MIRNEEAFHLSLSEVKGLGVLRSGRELLMSKAPDTEVTVAGLALAMADARNSIRFHRFSILLVRLSNQFKLRFI